MNLSDSVKSINERSSWKAIPLAVGPNVPYFNDLVEFEELDSYDLVIQTVLPVCVRTFINPPLTNESW